MKHKYSGFSPSNLFKVKEKRHNYSVGENNSELETAVSECTKKTGNFWDSNGEQLSLQVFCGVVGIRYNTFVEYVGENKLIN